MSESRKAFYQAFAKAQGAIGGAQKNSTNPHFRSKYADIGAVIDAIGDALSKNGIAYVQCPDFDGESGMLTLETILAHGDFEKSFKTRLPVSKRDAQGVGSAITYARRYALMSAFGIAPEDDDGNAASQPTGKGTGYKANGKPTASKAKAGGQGSWQAFTKKLETFTDPDECEVWFNATATQELIASWPKTDAGDWQELAADEYDKHIQSLYGTRQAAE